MAVRKNKTKQLIPALILGLFANVLLNTRTGYWSRPGMLTALLAIILLGCVGWLFLLAWRQVGRLKLVRMVFAAVLLASAALEVLRLSNLYKTVYPGATTLLGICLTVILPAVYLRRASSLSQTGNVVLALVFAAGILLTISIGGRLRLTNLQLPPFTVQECATSFRAQITLYPEYLLPALWYAQDKDRATVNFKVSGWAVAFWVSVNLLLELFFGVGLPGMETPVHAAARCGAISIFNRLEWMQLVLWTMAIVVKLALYLYAMIELTCPAGSEQEQTVPLPAVAGYLAAVALLAALVQRLAKTDLATLQNNVIWLLAVLTIVGGGIQCMIQKRRRVC